MGFPTSHFRCIPKEFLCRGMSGVLSKQRDVLPDMASQTVATNGRRTIFGQLKRDKGLQRLFAHNMRCHKNVRALLESLFA